MHRGMVPLGKIVDLAAGAARLQIRPGAGFFVSRAGNGTPWLLKELRGRRPRSGASRRASEGENAPRLRGRSGPHRQRRAMKSLRLIEAAGHQIPEPARRRLFCVQGRQRDTLAAEGAPRPSAPIRRQQESI